MIFFRASRSNIAGSIAEFGPALVLLILGIFLPLLNLLTVIFGIVWAQYTTSSAVRAAATSLTYGEALGAVEETARQSQDLFNFVRFKPAAARSLGTELFIDRYPSASSIQIAPTKFGPNKAYPRHEPLGSGGYSFLYTARLTGEIVPLLCPVLVSSESIGIPGLTKPLSFQCQASAIAEHPEGLTDDGKKYDGKQ